MSAFDDILARWPGADGFAPESLLRELWMIVRDHPDATPPHDLLARLTRQVLEGEHPLDTAALRALELLERTDVLVMEAYACFLREPGRHEAHIIQYATRAQRDVLRDVAMRSSSIHHAPWAFVRLHGLGVPGVLPHLRARFNTAAPENRYRWLDAIFQVEGPKRSQLMDILRAPHNNGEVSSALDEVIAMTPEEDTRAFLPVLLNIAQDETHERIIRRHAIEALGALQADDAVPQLLGLEDPGADFHRFWMRFHQQLGTPGLITHLLEHAPSPVSDGFVVWDIPHIVDMLLQGGGTSEEHERFRAWLQDYAQDTRGRALPTLAQLCPDNEDVFTLCVECLGRETPKERWYALEALARTQHSDTQHILQEHLQGDGVLCSIAAKWAVALADASWEDALLERAGSPSTWGPERYRYEQDVLLALGHIQTERSRAFLLEVAHHRRDRDTDPPLVEALRALDHPETQPALHDIATRLPLHHGVAPALGALAATGDTTAARQLHHLFEQTSRLKTVHALALLSAQEALPTILEVITFDAPMYVQFLFDDLLHEPWAMYALRSILMLGQYTEHPHVVRKLEWMTRDAHLVVRDAARAALAGTHLRETFPLRKPSPPPGAPGEAP